MYSTQAIKFMINHINWSNLDCNEIIDLDLKYPENDILAQLKTRTVQPEHIIKLADNSRLEEAVVHFEPNSLMPITVMQLMDLLPNLDHLNLIDYNNFYNSKIATFLLINYYGHINLELIPWNYLDTADWLAILSSNISEQAINYVSINDLTVNADFTDTLVQCNNSSEKEEVQVSSA